MNCTKTTFNPRPDWDLIFKNLTLAPDQIGSFAKSTLMTAVAVLKAQWENIQNFPRTLDGKAIHIRPENLPGLPKAVQIFGDRIFILNKGMKTKKIGKGFFKEPTRGSDLQSLKSTVHATIRLEDRQFAGGWITKEKIRILINKEIELMNMFKGDDLVVQLYEWCSYPSKARGLCPSVEKISLIMEDCEEGELFDAMYNQTAPSTIFNTNKQNLLLFVRELIEVLELLATKGVLHRDLKPENLFLKFKGKYLGLKLGDLGLAGMTKTEMDRLLQIGENIGGSPEFYSPSLLKAAEIIEDANAEERSHNRVAIDAICSHTNDVWAMGIVLYDFLLGDLPPFINNPDLTQEEVDLHLNTVLIYDNFLFECLKRDKKAQDTLFELIRAMLQVEQKHCQPPSELINYFIDCDPKVLCLTQGKNADNCLRKLQF